MSKRLKYLYEVVMNYDGDECFIWPFSKNGGYGAISVNKRPGGVSRIVCIEAHGQPPTPRHEAAHSCGKGHLGCVAKRHLSWKTPKENWADRYVHGTDNSGDRNGRAKLRTADVIQIKALPKDIIVARVAKDYGVSNSAIFDILKGRKWTHLK